MNQNAKKNRLLVVYIGMMAAMIFVATYFFKFEIPTPTGPVMIKTANILCLLSGLLFGGLAGGLSAGIGSMMFDLMDPKYAAVAPFTLCFFFLMGAICGWIAHGGGAQGKSFARNVIGVTAGALAYFVLNAARNIFTLTLVGSAFVPAVIANSTKLVVSSINLAVGIVGALALYKMIYPRLKRAGILDKVL